MSRRPQRSTRTDTHLPDTTLFRSVHAGAEELGRVYQAALPINAGMAQFAAAARAMPPISSKAGVQWREQRSEEHTSELQSLMRRSYAVFCLQKKRMNILDTISNTTTQTADEQLSVLLANNIQK